MLLSVAKESLRNSRQAVEKLLDSIPRDDHYFMGILGPILAALRDAERDIGRPSNQVSQATGPKSQQSPLNEPNAPRGC